MLRVQREDWLIPCRALLPWNSKFQQTTHSALALSLLSAPPPDVAVLRAIADGSGAAGEQRASWAYFIIFETHAGSWHPGWFESGLVDLLPTSSQFLGDEADTFLPLKCQPNAG